VFLARKYFWDPQSGAVDTIRLAGGGTTALGTNRDGLLTSTMLPGGEAVARTYTAVHAEAQVSTGAPYAATVTRYLNFDGAGRVTRQIDGSGVAGRAFSYDGLGRLVADSQISYQGPTNPCAEPNIVDENGNLCTYEGTWSTVPSGSVSFSYDGVGNRTDQGGAYGSANRIRQFAGCNYVTDSLGDGNVVSRTCGTEVVRFWWTAESRLAALKVVGGDSLDFRYDAGGRLVRKDVNGAAQAYFLWQGDNLLAELTGTATGKVAEYSYYPGLDNPHAVITGTTPHFAHVDGIGNVIALTDSAQNVKRDYDFDAWGGLRGGTDYKPFSGADRARFKGALWLGPQVDVYFMRARWYEPKSGRFLSEDPVGLEGGINPYAFAGSDPVNASDPTGLEVCVDKLSQLSDLEDAMNADIEYELKNGQYCVTGVSDRGGSSTDQQFLQWSLGIWAASPHMFAIDGSWANGLLPDAGERLLQACDDAKNRAGSTVVIDGAFGLAGVTLRGGSRLMRLAGPRAFRWGAQATLRTAESLMEHGYKSAYGLYIAGKYFSGDNTGWDYVPGIASAYRLIQEWKVCNGS
jgi:RHS repeat-associated protein